MVESIVDQLALLIEERSENINKILEKLIDILGNETDPHYQNSIMNEEESFSLHLSKYSSHKDMIVSFKNKKEITEELKEELKANYFELVGVEYYYKFQRPYDALDNLKEKK